MKHRPHLILGTLIVIAITQSSHAASGTWNVDADGLWGTNTNWLSNVIADDLTSTANFTNDITADRIVSLNADRTLNSVVFSDSATGTAGSWTLNNNGVSTNNLILSGTTGAATGTAPVIEVGSLGSGKTATISAIIQGSYGFTKTGAGTLVLSGANTYTGTTQINGGIVRVNASTSLGNSSGTITFGGGTLQYGGDVNYGTRIKNSSTAIVLDVNGRNVGFTSQQGIDNSNTGGLNLVNSGDTTTIVSGGTILFSGVNTFTGGISVGDKVRLRLQTTASALGNNTVTVQNGGQLFINSTLTITNELNIAGAGWTGDTGGIGLGAIRFNNGTTSDIQGQVTLSAAATVSASASITGTISGKITGNHALTVGAGAGTGIVTLTNSTNDYTGTTTINTGTLKVGAAGAIAKSSQIIVGANTTFDVSAVSFTLGASNAQTLSGTGAITGNLTVGGQGTLAIGTSPGTMTFGGNLGLNADSISNFEINGFTLGNHDLALAATAGTQTVTFNGGTLNLFFQSGFNTNGTVKIFDFDAYAGSGFTTVSATGLASGFTASFDQTNGIVTVVPEPGAALLGGLGLLALLRRRRLA